MMAAKRTTDRLSVPLTTTEIWQLIACIDRELEEGTADAEVEAILGNAQASLSRALRGTLKIPCSRERCVFHLPGGHCGMTALLLHTPRIENGECTDFCGFAV